MMRCLPRRELHLWAVVTYALCAAAWAPSTAKAAQRTATLCKGGGPGADRAAALVGHYLRQGLGRDERFELVPMGAVIGTQDRDHAIKTFGEAEESALKAREAYDQLDLDSAAALAKGALTNYERYAAYVDDFKKVSETLMLLGAISILRGDERQGAVALEQAINIYGQIEPDPRVFNPAMRAQFTKVAQRLSTRQGGTLSVASTPSNAEVYVDGHFVGVSPVAVQNVSEGRHFVRLRKDGLRPAGRVMQVLSRIETTDSAPLRPAPHFDEFDSLSDHVVHDIDEGDKDKDDKSDVFGNRRALAKLLQVDVLFVGRVRLDGERVHITLAHIDGRSGRCLRRGDHVFAYDTRKDIYEHEVAVLLHEHFAADSSKASGKESAPALAKASAQEERNMLPHAGGQVRCLGGHISCRGLKYTVGGTLMTLGVAALAVGGIEYALAAKTHREWTGVAQVSSRQGQLRARGQNQALMGDVLVGAGAALTLGASLTLALWHPAATAADVLREPHAAAAAQKRWHYALWPQVGGGSLFAARTF